MGLIHGPDRLAVIDGLKDLIADRRALAQEPDDIFSRDIQILEQAIALIQSMAKPM